MNALQIFKNAGVDLTKTADWQEFLKPTLTGAGIGGAAMGGLEALTGGRQGESGKDKFKRILGAGLGGAGLGGLAGAGYHAVKELPGVPGGKFDVSADDLIKKYTGDQTATFKRETQVDPFNANLNDAVSNPAPTAVAAGVGGVRGFMNAADPNAAQTAEKLKGLMGASGDAAEKLKSINPGGDSQKALRDYLKAVGGNTVNHGLTMDQALQDVKSSSGITDKATLRHLAETAIQRKDTEAFKKLKDMLQGAGVANGEIAEGAAGDAQKYLQGGALRRGLMDFADHAKVKGLGVAKGVASHGLPVAAGQAGLNYYLDSKYDNNYSDTQKKIFEYMKNNHNPDPTDFLQRGGYLQSK